MSNEVREEEMCVAREVEETAGVPEAVATQLPSGKHLFYANGVLRSNTTKVVIQNFTSGPPICPLLPPRFLVRSEELAVPWTVNELDEIRFLVDRFRGTTSRMSADRWHQIADALNAKFEGEYHQVGERIIGRVVTYYANGDWHRGRWILEVQDGEEKQIPKRSVRVTKAAIQKLESYVHMKKFLWVAGGGNAVEL